MSLPSPKPEPPILHTGTCHCGLAHFTLLTPPLPTQPTTTCPCTICARNAYALIYVPRANITWQRGQDEMRVYCFGPRRNDHLFCPVCGSSVMLDPRFRYQGVPSMEGAPDVVGVNVRMIKGVDMDNLTFTTDGWQWKKPSPQA
ncbi:hypothetical protein MMC12_005558 [Toensbergia leucococca]|nr:hypothetical protein [Toensbergia leucococca]